MLVVFSAMHFDGKCVYVLVSTILVEPSCEATVTDTGDISIQVLIVIGNFSLFVFSHVTSLYNLVDTSNL